MKVSSKIRSSLRRNSLLKVNYRPISTIVLSSLCGALRDLNFPHMNLIRRPTRHRARAIQHDPLRLSGIVDNLKFLPAPSRKIHQLGLSRLERMSDFAGSREPVEFSGLDRFFAEFRRCIVKDDSGVGSRFDYVEPFVFSAVPVWDGR